MSLTIPTHLKLRATNFVKPSLQNHVDMEVLPAQRLTKNPRIQHYYHPLGVRNPRLCCRKISVLTRACSDGGEGEFSVVKTQSPASVLASTLNDGTLALFVRLLGLDNDPKDRQQSVIALWKYSLGGKECVDNITKYPGTVNLIVNLLKSDSMFASEAAAGLLRSMSSINVYRDLVASSGAIEEMTDLLTNSSLSYNVIEQVMYTLMNLTVDEKIGARIANSEILSLLVKYLDDDDIIIREAAGGVLANLTLNRLNHGIMVEAGVIPKLAKILTSGINVKESKEIRGAVKESIEIRRVARNALLELSRDEYYRILIMEEGLLVVPLVGAEAYKSFKPHVDPWPCFPDGTKIELNSNDPSKFADSGLLGLHIDKNQKIDEAKENAMIGQSNQEFLARAGIIEIEDDGDGVSNYGNGMTLLPWIDGAARLVLILGLEDESAIARAAESIADASVNERMRLLFKEAGAVRNLFRIIDHPNESVKLAVVRALDKLSISYNVCQKIEEEGVLHPLVNFLKKSKSDTLSSSTSMILNILARILDPNKEMKSEVIEGDLVDSAFLSRLVHILRTPDPVLQQKAASILEFIILNKPSIEKLIPAEIESGLEAVFQQRSLLEDYDMNDEKPEIQILELEETGRAVSAASRLITKLLDHECFRSTLNSQKFTSLLRAILASKIPLENKDWVAACLVKLNSVLWHNRNNPVNLEVTLYETIPRLIEQMRNSFSAEAQEAAVVELNRIVSEGMVDSTRAIASGGGIFPLVKVMESGSDKAVEASLAVLYNLSMDSENHPAIIAAGAVPVLRKIVVAERPPWMLALRLLRNLPT